MKKALILTVGTGTRPETNIVKPLVKTVRNSSPDYVGFLVSAESRKYAEEIVKEVDLAEDAFSIVQLAQPDKIDQVFRAGNAMIRDIMARGFTCRDIAVDYTSGTKAMTGGLILSAVANSCEELKYITGQRRNGVVMDGTEEFLIMSPSAILAHREIQVAQLLICNYRFDAALDLLDGINPALLDEYDSRLAQNLEHLAHAYNYWDKFDHARYLGEYSQVAWGQKELEAFRSSDATRQQVTGIMKALKREELSEDMLADMFCNACRR
ncbi:MAG: TIGR02710 family CRISPR-associated CARF protein, partial [Pseudomonadota bacterium]